MKNLQECEQHELPKAIQDCIEEIANTDAGIVFLQYMHAICGYSRPSVVLDATGKVEHEATLANEARRLLYIEMRKYIPREKLIAVELPDLDSPKPIQDKLTVREKINARREHERNTDYDHDRTGAASPGRKRVRQYDTDNADNE